jgi:uncharacterized protein YacL (UPF0231 family)
LRCLIFHKIIIQDATEAKIRSDDEQLETIEKEIKKLENQIKQVTLTPAHTYSLSTIVTP